MVTDRMVAASSGVADDVEVMPDRAEAAEDGDDGDQPPQRCRVFDGVFVLDSEVALDFGCLHDVADVRVLAAAF